MSMGPDRAAAQQPGVSAGQLSDAAIPQDAPTPPAEMFIGGKALACFDAGCTPSDFASIIVPGGAFVYSSGTNIDFLMRSLNGVAGANGGLNGNFGLISLSTGTGFAPVSIPFTLQLIFTDPAADPVTVTGTVRGSLGPFSGGVDPRGAMILSFDDKRIVGGQTVKIDFVDATGRPGRMELTLPSILFPPDAPGDTGNPSAMIGGFFEIR